MWTFKRKTYRQPKAWCTRVKVDIHMCANFFRGASRDKNAPLELVIHTRGLKQRAREGEGTWSYNNSTHWESSCATKGLSAREHDDGACNGLVRNWEEDKTAWVVGRRGSGKSFAERSEFKLLRIKLSAEPCMASTHVSTRARYGAVRERGGKSN